MLSLSVGAPIRGSLYLCQLPDFGAWAAQQGAGLTPEEIIGLGASQVTYAAPARVPADSSVDFHNFLDLYRRGALVRENAPSNEEQVVEELRKVG